MRLCEPANRRTGEPANAGGKKWRINIPMELANGDKSEEMRVYDKRSFQLFMWEWVPRSRKPETPISLFAKAPARV